MSRPEPYYVLDIIVEFVTKDGYDMKRFIAEAVNQDTLDEIKEDPLEFIMDYVSERITFLHASITRITGNGFIASESFGGEFEVGEMLGNYSDERMIKIKAEYEYLQSL